MWSAIREPQLEQPAMLVARCAESWNQATYRLVDAHHSRNAYKKDGSQDGFIYYWDGCDGVCVQEWYMGPELGGDAVRVIHRNNDENPPPSGWYVFKDQTIHPTLQTFTQRIDNPLLCCFQYGDGAVCLNPKPWYDPSCIRDMCNSHCRFLATDCPRHCCAWQQSQDDKPRKELANRRRGGIIARGSRSPYEFVCVTSTILMVSLGLSATRPVLSITKNTRNYQI